MSTDYPSRKSRRSTSFAFSALRIFINLTICTAVALAILQVVTHLYNPTLGLAGNALRVLTDGALILAIVLVINHLLSTYLPMPRPLTVVSELSAEHAATFFVVIATLYLIGSIGFDIHQGKTLLHVYVPGSH